jgi:hypothetical protein
MKLVVAQPNEEPKEPVFSFSLFQTEKSVQVKVSKNGEPATVLVSFEENPYEPNEFCLVRWQVSKDTYSTDGFRQIAFDSTTETHKY